MNRKTTDYQSEKIEQDIPSSRHSDLVDAIRNHEIWRYLAWQDIRLRYRRSKIGPLWITLSMGLFCLSLGVVYNQLFKVEVSEYLPFLSIGFVLWSFMSSILQEFTSLFVENAPYIKEIKTNPLNILLRMVYRHLIIFAHNSIIIAIIYLCFGVKLTLAILLFIPGMFLLVLNMSAIGVSLALLGARFRDLGPIVQAMLQMLFFITPVTWFPRLLGTSSVLIALNPFNYFLDITRTPLLGNLPQMNSWVISMGTFILFSLFSAGLYRAKAHKIPFWV